MWSYDDIKALFELAGFVEDYCVDDQGDKVVFGGWNRVYLYPNGSIKVSGSHSNTTFLEIAEGLGIEIV